LEFRVGDECFCKMSISVDEVARESSSSRGVAAGLPLQWLRILLSFAPEPQPVEVEADPGSPLFTIFFPDARSGSLGLKNEREVVLFRSSPAYSLGRVAIAPPSAWPFGPISTLLGERNSFQKMDQSRDWTGFTRTRLISKEETSADGCPNLSNWVDGPLSQTLEFIYPDAYLTLSFPLLSSTETLASEERL
jgi:hypothetical protein